MKRILTLVSILMLGLVMACGQFDYYPQEYIVGLTPLSATTEKSNCTNIGNTGCFNVIVDYNQPLSKMISAGKYDVQESEISDENFPSPGREKVAIDLFVGDGRNNPRAHLVYFSGRGEVYVETVLVPRREKKVSVDLVLVHLPSTVTIKEVKECLAREKLEAASLDHLLALGAAYPDLQKQFQIFAIRNQEAGTLDGFYPFLGCYEEHTAPHRVLGIKYVYRNRVFNNWPKNARFLAIRKKSLLP